MPKKIILQKKEIGLFNNNSYFSYSGFHSLAVNIGEAAIKGILLELSCTPKPGLVDRLNNGANLDMNFTTFILSSSAISYGMYQCAQLGIDFSGKADALLPEFRRIGLDMERKMFKATGGINTQKGLIFLEGLVCVSAGSLIRKEQKLTPENICQRIKEITKGIVDRELKTFLNHLTYRNRKLTTGERLFLKYGITGVRGEVEEGLPTVRESGLPALQTALKQGLSLNDALVQALISIIAVLEDTNVIARSSPEILSRIVHPMANKAVQLGGMSTTAGRKEIIAMDRYFIKNNINPGGSADLLAVTATLYYLSSLSF